MKKLTTNQIEFLLKHFFQNPRYADWRNIAINLLNTGECIVAGDKCIWLGGIGNFIKTEPAKGAVCCSLYKFDLQNFLSSECHKEVKKEYEKDLLKKVRNCENELLEAKSELTDIENL